MATTGRNLIKAAAQLTLVKMLKNFLIRLLIVVIYACIIAAFFMHIEEPRTIKSKPEQPSKDAIANFVNETSAKLTVNLSTGGLKRIGNEILAFVDNGKTRTQTKAERFTTWLYFSFVTITTIGYGDVTPKTNLGKTFVIVFSTIGIPLMLWLLGIAGQIHTEALRMLAQAVKNCRKISKNEERTQLKTSSSIVLILVVICSALTQAFGSLYTKGQTGWSYLDCVYFWFCTSTTIGYGDLLKAPDNAERMPLWISVKLVGLAQIAGLINTMLCWLQERQFSKIKTEAIEISDTSLKDRECNCKQMNPGT